MSLATNLNQEFSNKKVLIWGFGKEGKSSYLFIRHNNPEQHIYITDAKPELLKEYFNNNGDQKVTIVDIEHTGHRFSDYDLILKSPGISTKRMDTDGLNISCQADLFIKHFKLQTIGITGSKGKSTTASLTHHLLKSSNFHCLLGGNIGIPPFELIDQIEQDTLVVLELSAHQLQYCKHSPRIAILLNLFEEHLDHFGSYEKYAIAKMNIANFQNPGDLFFCNQDIDYTKYIPEGIFPMGHCIKSGLDKQAGTSLFMEVARLKLTFGPIEYKLCGFTDYVTLPGKHNLYNSMIATAASLVCGADPINIRKGFYSYETLDHRLQFAGIFNGVKCYNDSIATIPEATMQALETLEKVDILLLGGFDRGINYDHLIEYLANKHTPRVIICMRDAGKRIHNKLNKLLAEEVICKNVSSLPEAIEVVKEHKQTEDVCLLSPAAASYGEFKDFEERGKSFIELMKKAKD